MKFSEALRLPVADGVNVTLTAQVAVGRDRGSRAGVGALGKVAGIRTANRDRRDGEVGRAGVGDGLRLGCARRAHGLTAET